MKDAADSDIVKQQMADPATNVLTGESFGKAESLRDFDLTSLFSIDTNTLKNAFSFDADALDFDLNLSLIHIYRKRPSDRRCRGG